MRTIATLNGQLGYGISKRRALRRMQRATGRPVVVFSMGKTGSTSVANALKTVSPRPVFHIHRLTPGSITAAEGRYRRTDPSARPVHLWESAHLVERLPTPAAPWDIVTLAREPLAQAISAFFQPGGRVLDLRSDVSVDTLTRTFADQTDYRNPLRWFDREFAPSLGIDVYDHAFDPAVGYAMIETPAVRVLILRTENLGAAPDAMAEFFGLLDPVPVPVHNVAAEKQYADTYRDFVREAIIPEEILDRVYRSRYARHFYSAEEIERFRHSWERATPAQ